MSQQLLRYPCRFSKIPAENHRSFAFKPAHNTKFQQIQNVRIASSSGRSEPFNEGAAQVRRLIDRDRKEFMGNEDNDILEKYEIEFGNETPKKDSSDGTSIDISSTTVNPFGSGTISSPFGSSPASPFGAAASKPFKSAIEPTGLRPDMSPDPILKESKLGFLQSITMTQVVLFFSFSFIIGLMIATFYVVLGTGAVRLNGID